MYTPTAIADEILNAGLTALACGDAALFAALDALEAPLYLTDARGLVTYFNPACVAFAGRTPRLGLDRWCVSWKLYTDDGRPLAHEDCPLAIAIRERRPVRRVTAVAERPDGSRVVFVSLATPLLDSDDGVRGAVNLLIDVTEERQIVELRSQARRCERLARGAGDQATADTLVRMSAEYEAKANGMALASPRRRYINL